jgi:MFS-type transporter involved in bile tolerance (Atg22 family)
MNLKIIFLPILNDDRFLVYCAISGTAVSIFGAFIWGYLGDKKGFFKTLLVFAILDTIIKIYGDFAKTRVTIWILFILIGLTDKGMLTIMGPGLVKMFGI